MANNFFLACEASSSENTLNTLLCSIHSEPVKGIDWAANQGWIMFIGWALIVIGWSYNNHKSNVRESRKELKALVDTLVEDIKALKEKALLYYVSPIKGSDKLGFEIVAAQHSIVSRIDCLSKKYPNTTLNAKKRLLEFIDVITGGDFDSYRRKVTSYANKKEILLLRIHHISVDLCNAIEADFDHIVEDLDSWFSHPYYKKLKQGFTPQNKP